MSDERDALLRQILLNPEDLAPRLVLADWFEERNGTYLLTAGLRSPKGVWSVAGSSVLWEYEALRAYSLFSGPRPASEEKVQLQIPHHSQMLRLVFPDLVGGPLGFHQGDELLGYRLRWGGGYDERKGWYCECPSCNMRSREEVIFFYDANGYPTWDGRREAVALPLPNEAALKELLDNAKIDPAEFKDLAGNHKQEETPRNSRRHRIPKHAQPKFGRPK